MIGIIGRKLGMTQIFNENGEQVPCTVIAAEPNPVLAVTDKAAVGFASVQLGFERFRTAREDAQNGRTPRGLRAPQGACDRSPANAYVVSPATRPGNRVVILRGRHAGEAPPRGS